MAVLTDPDNGQVKTAHVSYCSLVSAAFLVEVLRLAVGKVRSLLAKANRSEETVLHVRPKLARVSISWLCLKRLRRTHIMTVCYIRVSESS